MDKKRISYKRIGGQKLDKDVVFETRDFTQIQHDAFAYIYRWRNI